MKAGYIYTLAHPITNEIVYIGKTTYSLKYRLSGHIVDSKRHNRKICTWISKLRKQDLVPIIEELDKASENELPDLEKFYISLFKVWGFKLKNHTDGGEGMSGYKCSKQTCELHSKQTKGENNPFYGKKHSLESKKLIGKANTGKTRTEVFKNRRKEIQKDWKPSENMIKRMTEVHGRRVIQFSLKLEYINTFYTIREACKSTNSLDSKITLCCQNKRKTHNGFIWKYETDYLKNKDKL